MLMHTSRWTEKTSTHTAGHNDTGKSNTELIYSHLTFLSLSLLSVDAFQLSFLLFMSFSNIIAIATFEFEAMKQKAHNNEHNLVWKRFNLNILSKIGRISMRWIIFDDSSIRLNCMSMIWRLSKWHTQKKKIEWKIKPVFFFCFIVENTNWTIQTHFVWIIPKDR